MVVGRLEIHRKRREKILWMVGFWMHQVTFRLRHFPVKSGRVLCFFGRVQGWPREVTRRAFTCCFSYNAHRLIRKQGKLKIYIRTDLNGIWGAFFALGAEL